jgi:hypothetical protein
MSVDHDAVFGIGAEVNFKNRSQIKDNGGDFYEYVEEFCKNSPIKINYSEYGDECYSGDENQFVIFLEDDKVDEGLPNRLKELIEYLKTQDVEILETGLVGGVHTW